MPPGIQERYAKLIYGVPQPDIEGQSRISAFKHRLDLDCGIRFDTETIHQL